MLIKRLIKKKDCKIPYIIRDCKRYLEQDTSILHQRPRHTQNCWKQKSNLTFSNAWLPPPVTSETLGRTVYYITWLLNHVMHIPCIHGSNRHMCMCSLCHNFLAREIFLGTDLRWCSCTLAVFSHSFSESVYKSGNLWHAQKWLNWLLCPSHHPRLLWHLTIATIWKMAAEFRRWHMAHLLWEVPEMQNKELVLSQIFLLASLVNLEPKQPPLAEEWHNCRRRAVSQSSREAEPKGWSHVACNFLEAIKPTLFNSLSNTLAIFSVKWSFSAQLSIQSWKTGMWKHFAK